jgi:bifunctional non-homologous end joining protein LigD
MLPRLEPLTLARKREPFDHPDWLFEIKFDGFRSLAYIRNGECELVSRNRNTFKTFPILSSWIGQHLNVEAVIDGEIVSLDEYGRSQFAELFYHRGDPYFYAFDLLWLNGEDLRDRPLIERKNVLRTLLGKKRSRMLFLDHIAENGRGLFEQACHVDLEGIVAKPQQSLYRHTRKPQWVKIKNRAYTQLEGREDFFN